MDYQALLNKYNELLEENSRLKNENLELRKMLGVNDKVVTSCRQFSNANITKHSLPEEKIALFRSFFRGREDVFARRWYSKTTGKSGYQPVCENEWAENICDKKKYKCSVCPNRKLLPLTDKDIFNHLSGKDFYGRDVIGIYSMLKDETCYFLCVDFDGENYQNDATAFRKTCEEYGISVSVERSRSGNGTHVWVFFSEPISATLARKLGSGLLTKTMENNSQLDFKSYDRLFPNQDTMPKGNFGNLIALPLQGQARKSGNSLFVDENFVPFDDQWAYLSTVQKLSLENVELLVNKICKGGDLGTLVTDSDERPWELKRIPELSAFDFPDTLMIIRANMLYIPTKDLSPSAQNHVKRLAAFKNSDFYKAQAMRLPIYDKPRVICTAEITKDYIGIPRGCEAALYELLNSCNVNYSFEDKTNSGHTIPVTFSGILREDQQPAADALLQQNTGVLSATTAFGKTVVASYLIGERKTNTLILVHTQNLLQQWKKSLETFLDLDIVPPTTKTGKVKKNWSPIGTLYAGKNTLQGNVDIALMQSLVNGDEVKELVRNYGMIIVDECHHVSAVNFEKILRFANAKYVYGLTATPTRQDGQHPIIFMQCEPIRYRVNAKEQAQKRDFEHSLIPRFTSYRSLNNDKNISEFYTALAEDEIRNALIIRDVIKALQQNRCPIILTERREHVMLLAERLLGHCENIITLIGTASAKERKETLERLANIPDNEQMVIIATGKYVGEGFDYPRLDTLFLALPIAWKGKVAQYVGRLHRDYPGKTEVQVYDYVDIHLPVLERMYQKRLKGYSSIGYKIKFDDTQKAEPDLIYNGKSFYSVYCQDIKSATKEVLIVSPFMRKGRITQLMKTIAPIIMNGVPATVITRPPEDFKGKEKEKVAENIEVLQNYGIKVICKSGFHQKITIIDQQVVWYGSVNFLSFGISEESIMRFTDYNIAGQLLDTVI